MLYIDVSGKDILNTRYAIAIVLDDKYCYGYRFEEKVQRKIRANYISGAYNLPFKKNYINLKIRLYSAIVARLLKEVINKHKIKEFIILMCNDFDGHFNDIIQYLESNTNIPDIKEKTHLHRHCKDSLIQISVKALSKGEKRGICIIGLKLKEIEELIKKKHIKKSGK